MNINGLADINTEAEISFNVDEDDLAHIIRPMVVSQVDNEIDNYDLEEMVSDAVRMDGDARSDNVDIEHEAQQLLNQYINGHGTDGNHDDTGCITAKRFETAVFHANCRLSASEQGSGAFSADIGRGGADTLAEVRRLAEQVAAIQRALNALPAAILTADPDRDQEQPILG